MTDGTSAFTFAVVRDLSCILYEDKANVFLEMRLQACQSLYEHAQIDDMKRRYRSASMRGMRLSLYCSGSHWSLPSTVLAFGLFAIELRSFLHEIFKLRVMLGSL